MAGTDRVARVVLVRLRCRTGNVADKVEVARSQPFLLSDIGTQWSGTL